MNLFQVVALAVGAFLLRRFSPRRLAASLLLVAGMIVLYRLQPSSPLRYLDFWLPSISIILTAIIWAATQPGDPERAGGLSYGLLIAAGVLLVAGARYFEPLCCLTQSRPPPVLPVVGMLTAAALLIGVMRRFPVVRPLATWLLLAGLVCLLILLKTPSLAARLSLMYRSSAGQTAQPAGPNDWAWLGFSFLAFRLIHVLRDAQAGKLPRLSLPQFAAYALFFPTLVAGPIDRIQRWNSDFERVTGNAVQPAVSSPDVPAGAWRILVGLFKKFALADSLALFALNGQNAHQTGSTGWMWVLLLGYSMRIYLDFSGYSDVAIGLGRLMGFRLPENFTSPYFKTNLTAFWNSWHITLAQWFRAYVFNPLVRRLRVGQPRLPVPATVFAGQVVTMTLIGLWHGITWNFFIWGLWHALGLFVHNRWSDWIAPRLEKLDERPAVMRALQIGGWALNFLFVSLGWVWFALPSPGLALHVFARLFGQ